MLKLFEGKAQELYDFCKRDSFGTKIAGSYKTYENNFQFAMFYVQLNDENEITAAASKIYGSVILSVNDNADFEEIREFLNVVGYSTVSCEFEVCKKLKLDATRNGNIVEFRHNEREPQKAKIDYFPSLPKIYDLLKSVDFDLGEKSDWMADISMRMRKDVSVWSTVEEEKLKACACALYVTDDAAFLGCVACDNGTRGAGLGSEVVLRLIKTIGQNKRINLFCKNGKIVEFYKKLGFDVVGKWAESEYTG